MEQSYSCELKLIKSGERVIFNMLYNSIEELFSYLKSLEQNNLVEVVSVKDFNGKLLNLTKFLSKKIIF